MDYRRTGAPDVARAREAAAKASAIAAVAPVAVLIALAASNTAQVKVDWVVGSSHISLVWLVLVAAIVGWLLGLLASARFNWRTRPRGAVAEHAPDPLLANHPPWSLAHLVA
jgi:uncharacterized integral membrane protein